MRILILGGAGMFGHRLLHHLRPRHDVRVTVRRRLGDPSLDPLFHEGIAFHGVHMSALDRLIEVMAEFRPEVVINCIGIVKQRPEATDTRLSLEVNALLPHRLLDLCRATGTRLVHLSTDCVFSGAKGSYTEDDPCDVSDVYGLTKYLGEVRDPPALTIRSSIIGLELEHKAGLVEWFLAQRGEVPGFTRAMYSGLTTAAMSRLVEFLLVERPDLSGLWHVASSPISKFDLLEQLSARLERQDVTLVPSDQFVCLRDLDASRFCLETGWTAPSWSDMLDELAGEIRAREREAA